MARQARRGYGDDSVYFDAVKQRWTGAVSLGYTPDGTRRVRRKVTGKTKTEVKDKLKALRREMDAGIHSSPSYTMALCIEDWLSQGLTKLSPSTVANYRSAWSSHRLSALPWTATTCAAHSAAGGFPAGALSCAPAWLTHPMSADAQRREKRTAATTPNTTVIAAAQMRESPT